MISICTVVEQAKDWDRQARHAPARKIRHGHLKTLLDSSCQLVANLIMTAAHSSGEPE